ncbi:MAG: tRNA (adenosine(37)-N6)-threonylcarbamoyltransferase complex ATPase subunit type 1 TsaE [Erysipelotrichaceae bacterium]
MTELKISNLEDTQAIASHLADLCFPGAMILLTGDLGAGKTTFTKAFGKQLGVSKVINSPTFTILKTYQGKFPLYHIDAYRLEDTHQDLGFEELFESDGVCVIEWPHFIEEFLPSERLEIELYRVDEDARLMKVHGIGAKYQVIEEALACERCV